MISIHITAAYRGPDAPYEAVGKTFQLAAVPHKEDWIYIEPLDIEYEVEEVHFGTDGTVGIAIRLFHVEKVQILRKDGWK